MKNQLINSPIKKKYILLIIAVISLLIIMAGYSFYKNEEKSIRNEKYNLIKGIAELKINQLTEWYLDELNDAELITLHIQQNYLITSAKNDQSTKQRINKLLNDIKKEHSYNEIIIVDSSSNVLFTTNINITEIDSVTKHFVKIAYQNNKPVSTDIYFCKTHNELHIDFIILISENNAQAEQVAIFRMDSNRFLFPLISHWPTPSKTAETLLIRREGDYALFLNELRHQKNTALKLRIPITKTEIPAVQSALGHQGIFEGIDYRGVKVLSYTSKVPNTPWYMVAKIDQSEIYSELYFRTGVIIVSAVFMIVFVSILLFLYYNLKQKNLYKKLYEAEESYKITLRSIGDAVITTDINGKITYMNPVAEKLTGWEYSEARNQSLENIFRIIDEFKREKVKNPVEQVLREGIVVNLANHTLLLSKSGKEIPIADSGASIRNENGETIGVVLVFRDQTKERQSQKEIYHLNRLYKMLSECNQVIVRIKERDLLFEELCKASVDYGEFCLAWIGLYDKIKNKIIPYKWFLDENGFLSKDYLIAPQDKLELMPCIRAFKESRAIAINDILNNPDCEFWKDAAINRNIFSMAAAPIKLNNENIGVYVLYSSEKNFFGEKELSLVQEVASDISYALNSIQTEEAKKITELKLKESEETYRNLFQNAQVGLYRTRISDGKILESNTRLAEMFGYSTREEFIAEFSTAKYYVDPGTRERMLMLLKENGFVQNFEARFYKKDKSIFWARYSARIYPDKDWIEGVFEDVTQLKLFENALLESEKKFRLMAENAQDLIYRYEFYPTRGFTYVSPSATTITGYSPEEHYADPDLGFKIVHPEDRHLLQSVAAGEELIKKPVTLRWIRKDGKIIWTEQKNIPLYNEKGEIIAIEGIARDVTKIKLAEQELIKSEERYRSIYENALVGIYRTTPDGKILLANPTLIKMLGYSSFDELAERNLNEIGYEPEYNREDFIKILCEKNVIDSFDSVWNKKDGTKIFIRESVKVIKDKENNPIYFEGIVQDITEKKFAEDKLKESEEKYRAISEMISDYAYSFMVKEGNKLVIEWVTDSFQRITGYTTQEIDERGGWTSLIHPEDMHIALKRARSLFEGIEDASEFRIIRKDGTIRWLRDYGKPIWDAKLKRVVKILGAAKDITENKKVEESLINERILLRTVIDNLPVAIYVKDKYMRKALANKADLQNMGYEKEIEVLGKTDYDFYSKEEADKFIFDDKRVIENGVSILNKEESFVDKNGNLKWLLTSKIPLRNLSGEIEGLLGIGIDITERKKFQEELILAKERAEESDKLKSEFLAQMSHEIRTPLHIITSSLGLVEEDLAESLSEEDLELFANIKISAKRIMRTINLILNMSEMQLGLYQPNFKEIDLEKNILLPLINEHKPLAAEKKLNLEMFYNSTKRFVYADEYSVTQIFANLIDNAIKYTNKGSVEISVYEEKDGIVVEVKDTGIGMSEEFMKNLFKPFMQEEHGMSRSYEGNGLGLSLVKKYCELNDAEIEVSSKKNIGTIFRVTLKISN